MGVTARCLFLIKKFYTMQGFKSPISGGNPQTNFPALPSVNVTQTITASATPHAKGSWAELFASTTYDSYGFWLLCSNTASATTITSFLLDIGIGANPNEVPIIENLIMSSKGALNVTGGIILFIPLFIPKGSRVVARGQALIASDTIDVTMALSHGSDMGQPIYSRCDTYGINTGTSRGTDHTAGNSGAESTDATIGTSDKQYKAVLLLIGANNSTAQTAVAYHYEFRMGGITFGEWMIRYTTQENSFAFFPPCAVPVNVPPSTAMQVRGEASGTAQSNDVALYCFY